MASDEEKEDLGWTPGENDRHPSNLLVRAGYLRGMLSRTTNAEDRIFLRRAVRSLLAFHEQEQKAER